MNNETVLERGQIATGIGTGIRVDVEQHHKGDVIGQQTDGNGFVAILSSTVVYLFYLLYVTSELSTLIHYFVIIIICLKYPIIFYMPLYCLYTISMPYNRSYNLIALDSTRLILHSDELSLYSAP
jgi:hypothetical protein